MFEIQVDWIVWTDLLFKRLENRRRQRVFLRGHTYISFVYKCYRGNQRGGNKMLFLRPPALPADKKRTVPYSYLTPKTLKFVFFLLWEQRKLFEIQVEKLWRWSSQVFCVYNGNGYGVINWLDVHGSHSLLYLGFGERVS